MLDNGVWKEAYVLLPNKIIWDKKGGDSLMKITSDKLIIIMTYLDLRTTRIGDFICTLEDMCKECGYSHKTANLNELKDILLSLRSSGLLKITSHETIEEIKPKDLIKGILCNDCNTEFFKVNIQELNKILNSNIGSQETRVGMVNLYFYIKSRIKKRDKSLSPASYGYNAEATWFSTEQVIKDLNISKNTFEKYLKNLVDMNMICYGNIGLVSYRGVEKVANNVYTLEESELKQGLAESKYYYIKEGYTVLNKRKNKVTKQIEGLKGRIKQLEKQGYDTFELVEKLHQLESKLEPDKK